MKEGRSITLNDKGILSVTIIILTLTFALGFMASTNRKEKDVTIFTKEDLERIIELQSIEDEKESGAEIYAYKDKNGNLMIGWNTNDSDR